MDTVETWQHTPCELTDRRFSAPCAANRHRRLGERGAHTYLARSQASSRHKRSAAVLQRGWRWRVERQEHFSAACEFVRTPADAAVPRYERSLKRELENGPGRPFAGMAGKALGVFRAKRQPILSMGADINLVRLKRGEGLAEDGPHFDLSVTPPRVLQANPVGHRLRANGRLVAATAFLPRRLCRGDAARVLCLARRAARPAGSHS
jgi:hypothetical protein